ncbi:MAG TPA: hypothetical protein VGM56_03515 [Byssovorax sp.]|jgi:hypothetical protein
MKWTIGLLAAVLLGGGWCALAAGCGEDDCSRAADHTNACLNIPSSTASASEAASSSTGGQPANECTGLTACAAGCVNNATCDEITDAALTPPGPAATALLECEQNCELTSGINQAGYEGHGDHAE